MGEKALVLGVTGATGAIGKALVEFLATKPGIKILALVRRQARFAGGNTQTILGDLFDRAALGQLVSQSDVVIHLAARNPQAKEQDRKDQLSFFGTNSVGAMNVAALAVQHQKRLIHISSVAVYELSLRRFGTFDEQEQLPGRPETKEWVQKAEVFLAQVAAAWMKEGSRSDPRGELSQFLGSSPPPENERIYPLSKFLGEPQTGIVPEGVILRLSDVYGPGHESRGIVQGYLSALLGGEEMVIDFGLRGLVSFIYMRDVLETILAAATAAPSIPRIINVASPVPVGEAGLKDCLKKIGREAGSHSAIRAGRTSPAEDFSSFDVEKMKQHLGLKEPMLLLEGLRQTLRYLQLTPERKYHF